MKEWLNKFQDRSHFTFPIRTLMNLLVVLKTNLIESSLSSTYNDWIMLESEEGAFCWDRNTSLCPGIAKVLKQRLSLQICRYADLKSQRTT